jgi:hypothetical protein
VSRSRWPEPLGNPLVTALKKRVLITIACAVILTVGVLGWSVASHYWVTHKSLESPLISDLQAGVRPQESFKWRALGTGAVPILITASQYQPDALSIAYSKAWARIPAQIQSNLPAPVDGAKIRMAALGLLADPQLGTNVQISTLTNALQDRSWPVRYNALACLGNAVLPVAGPERIQVLPQLIAAAADREMMIRMLAVVCLEFFKDVPDRVIPTLTKRLADDSPDVRIRAARAFYKIDPAAAERAGALSVAANCLHSDGPHGAKGLAIEFLQKLGKLPSDEKN